MEADESEFAQLVVTAADSTETAIFISIFCDLSCDWNWARLDIKTEYVLIFNMRF